MLSLTRLLPLLLFVALVGCGSGASADAGESNGGAGGAAAGGAAGAAGVGGDPAGGSAGVAGTSGVGGVGQTGGSGGIESCPAVPTCGAPPPDPGPTRDWRHSVASPLIVNTGFANLRGRDLFLAESDEQWVIGKVAYGVTDKDLKDEEVDIWLLRDCAGTSEGDWEFLGTAITTQDGMHPPVEGVDDSGGRVYFQIPAAQRLGRGRHRIHLVVAGDHSSADLYIEVLPDGQQVFVTDVDGTLTTKENEEFTALLTGTLPNVNSGAPEALRAIAARGYRPFYLTARPEFLVGRTREFLEVYGFPPGIVHTTTTLTGATGNAAVGYKLGELNATYAKGFPVIYAFGNTASDAEAFASAGVADGRRMMYQFTDSSFGCTRFDDYSALVPTLSALPLGCLYW